MTPDINLIHEIPQEVKDAAILLGNYFKKQNIRDWALYDVRSRNSAEFHGSGFFDGAAYFAAQQGIVSWEWWKELKHPEQIGGDGIDYHKSF